MNKIEKKGQNNSDNKNRKNLIWQDRQFAYPQRSIRLATTFSGIGAIEYAFKRLRLKHEIIFAGQDEVIEIKHTAYSKALFANGAVEAAKFLAGKPAGRYDMRDVIRAKQ